MEGKLSFYGEVIDIKFPKEFDSFAAKIAEILSISKDDFAGLKLIYQDEDKDKVEITNPEDYSQFLEQVSKNQVNLICAEIKENSYIDLNNATQSLINLKKSKNKEQNDVTDKKSENKNEVINNIVNKEEQVNINNNNQNKEGGDKIIEDYIKIDSKFSNLNDNNINNNSDKAQLEFDSMNKAINYPVSCNLCSTFPVTNVLYLCPKCDDNLCEKCEKKFGPRHKHALIKVQNLEQFKFVNEDKQQESKSILEKVNETKVGKFVGELGNLLGKGVNSVTGMFSGKNDDNNNLNVNIYNPGNQNQKKMTLVQLARAQYDLRNVTDEMIEEALKKTKGNIDEAVITLVS